jgi:serine/threonine protein kinase
MGVAASTTGVGGAAADDMAHLAQDWPKHIVEARLLPGSGRMMRSYRLRSDNAVYVCKTMVLRMDNNSSNNSNHEKEEMRQHEQELQRLKTLLEVPSQAHVMPFSEWKVSSSPHAMSRQATLSSVPVYLVRPHVYATLADRSATRPFLTGVESAWIAKQILEALDALHQAGISHGNLSCENIGLTSWNWVLLLDLGSYKQVKLADDDPSDFIQYYQEVTTTTHDNSTTTTTTTTGTTGTSGDDKRCYIAPERFYTKLNLKKTDSTDSHRSSGSSHADPTLDRTSSTEPTTLTPAMDIFSAGCVLMELFLNGERVSFVHNCLAVSMPKRVFSYHTKTMCVCMCCI